MVATPLVRSPMVAGTLHPVLLTPTGTAPKGADYMLAHELTHIKRHDVAKKLLFTLACAVHWYNPAVWLLAARAGRDIEEACDAETLCGRDADCRAAYADALARAVELAKTRASVLAEASGQELGYVINIEEYGDRQEGRYVTSNMSMKSAPGAGAAEEAVMDMGVMPGEMEVTASIRIEFALFPKQ